MTTSTLALFHEKVDALLDAYRTGTPEAMERHWRHTWHRRAWGAMRTYVQIDLGHAASDDIEISHDEALADDAHQTDDTAAAAHQTRSIIAQQGVVLRSVCAN